jgi:hypothetical protein
MGDATDLEVLLSTPAHLNVNKISRQLRRSDLSLRNCLHSVDVDARWVARLAACFPGLPVVANLRCGLWYTREAQATAYFKVRPVTGGGLLPSRPLPSAQPCGCLAGCEEPCVDLVSF